MHWGQGCFVRCCRDFWSITLTRLDFNKFFIGVRVLFGIKMMWSPSTSYRTWTWLDTYYPVLVLCESNSNNNEGVWRYSYQTNSQITCCLPEPRCQKPTGCSWLGPIVSLSVTRRAAASGHSCSPGALSSAATSCGSLSGCRRGRWAGAGSLDWGWRPGGLSLFWWPPPGSGFVWSSGRPAPEWLSGSLPQCSGPAPYLHTENNRNNRKVHFCYDIFHAPLYFKCLFITY